MRRLARSSAFIVAVFAFLIGHAAQGDEIDVDRAIDQTIHLIKRHDLTSLDIACLTFQVERHEPGGVKVVVREKHDERCGGDPATGPRLFTILLDERRGVASSDATNIDGVFRELGPIE